jgi:hypothetical protein
MDRTLNGTALSSMLHEENTNKHQSMSMSISNRRLSVRPSNLRTTATAVQKHTACRIFAE